MKNKILSVTAVVICLSIAVGGTLAYFTAEDTAHNVITSGGVSIKLVEQTKGEDDVLVDFPADGVSGIMPGANVSKIVSVKNTGEHEVWVRVQLEPKITNADGSPLSLYIEDDSPVMNFNFGDNWQFTDNYGYFYYLKPVAPGECTDILFDTVSFTAKMGNEYQGCTANIKISAQAVQVANNGSTVMEAAGWPEV